MSLPKRVGSDGEAPGTPVTLPPARFDRVRAALGAARKMVSKPDDMASRMAPQPAEPTGEATMIAKGSQGRAGVLRRTVSVCWALALLAGAASVGARPAANAPIEVRAGDTFSSLVARHGGKAASWRSMYRPDASQLSSPDRLAVGMRFEVATDDKGRYLRLVAPHGVNGAAERPAARVSAPAAAAGVSPGGGASAPASATAPAAAAVPPVGGDAATLVVGVLPNIPAATLNTQYAYLKNYLERVEHRDVRIVVPANFKVFFDGMMQGAYDLAVAAPHFARVGQADRGMVPLAMYEPRINALFVAPLDSPLAGPRDVRERTVAFANPTSLVALYGQQWLRQAGLEAPQDYAVKAARTDLGVGRMLLTGEAAAAIMSNGEFRALPAEESARLKVVEIFARIPNFVVLGHPRIGRERLSRLKTELKDFLADKDDGAAFKQATGIGAIVDADEPQLRELDAFNAATRRAMGSAP